MTLAYVQLAIAIVVGLIGSCTGFMIAIAVLLPSQAARAEQAIETSPRRCFLMGLAMAALAVVAQMVVRVPNPLVKLAGIAALLALGGVLGVGAAGIAQLMGKRIGAMAGQTSSFSTLVRGCVVFNLAGFFPLLGWWLFAPIAALFALGAGYCAFRPELRTVQPPASAPGFDLSRAV